MESRTGQPTSTRTRVFFVEQNEDHTVGGSHQAMYDLVTGLDAARWEPVAAFYQDNLFVRQFRAAGIETHVLEQLRAREHVVRRKRLRMVRLAHVPAAIVRRARLLRALRIDLVHLINSPCVGFDDWLPAARLAGVPILTSAMAVLDDRRFGPIQRWLQRGFDVILPVSRHIREAWIERGLPPDRLVTVHHGVSLDRLRRAVRRTPADVRAELGVSPGHAFVVMVANIRSWKGQHVVLQALLAMDPGARGRIRLAMVGAVNDDSAGYYRQLVETVERSGLRDTVVFPGSRRDVPDLLRAADVALHASVLPEPGGLVVLEAMALGVPVIASNRGGHVEVLTPETGIVIDPDRPGELADALARLIEDPDLRRRMGEAARHRIEGFDIARNIDETERVYRAILEGRRPVASVDAGELQRAGR